MHRRVPSPDEPVFSRVELAIGLVALTMLVALVIFT
jgi:hypothetical protein